MADLMTTAQVLKGLTANYLGCPDVLDIKEVDPIVNEMTRVTARLGQLSNKFEDITDPTPVFDELEANLQRLEEAGKVKALNDIMRRYTVSKNEHEAQKKVRDKLEGTIKLDKLAIARDSTTVFNKITEAGKSGKPLIQVIRDIEVQGILKSQPEKLVVRTKEVDKLDSANKNIKSQVVKQLHQAVQELTATAGPGAQPPKPT
jgi:hypothetical protein